MRFVPHYTVSYRGRFYRCGQEMEIEEKDAASMERHGRLILHEPSEGEKASQAADVRTEDKPARRGGRPKKQA